MQVKSIKDIEGTERDVVGKGFRSLRLLLEKDGMGFSLHKTLIPKGKAWRWHYKHHLEACFCVQGRGVLTDLSTNISYEIEPDTIYVLDKHDAHTFQALEDVILISVFNPPVKGNEIHKEDGSYEANIS